jgi:flagellar protein FliT
MDQTRLIEQLLEITQDIEAAASLADWQRAAELDATRTPLMRTLDARQSPHALALIRQIQAIDAAVLANARQSRGELQTEYQAAMKRVAAARQYQQAARL